jgi:hypothetical protein
VIKIDSFSPIDNFTRRSWEFYDDRIVVKTKSLTFDYENEVKYEKIKSIQSRSVREFNWIWTSFITVGLVGIADLGLGYFCITSPIIDVVEKVFITFALAMLPLAFLKYEYYSFLDADKNFLATVRAGKKNKPMIFEAIKLIKQKAEITKETYFDTSFSSDHPVFQFSEFDIADFLNKSKVSVYDDKIVDVEKSLAEELTTVVRFDELSGKTKFAKMGNDKWDYVWSYWLFFVTISGISISTFFAEWLKGNRLFGNLYFGGLALLIPLILMRYIKSEILVFYDKKDNGVFWTRVNKANREKLNQIVEFVKGKVESQT